MLRPGEEGSSALVLKYLQLQSEQAGLKSVYERQSLYQEKRFLEANTKIFNLEKLIGELHEAVRRHATGGGGQPPETGGESQLQEKLKQFMKHFETQTVGQLKEFVAGKVGGALQGQLEALEQRVRLNEEKLSMLALQMGQASQAAHLARSQVESLRSLPERDASEVWREIGALKIDLQKGNDNFLQLKRLVDLEHQALNRKTSELAGRVCSPHARTPAKLTKVGSTPLLPDSGKLHLEMLHSGAGALTKFEPSPTRDLMESLRSRGFKF